MPGEPGMTGLPGKIVSLHLLSSQILKFSHYYTYTIILLIDIKLNIAAMEYYPCSQIRTFSGNFM